MKDFVNKVKVFLQTRLRKRTAEELMEKWEKEKPVLEADLKIDEERRNLRILYKGEAIKRTTSKMLIAFLFVSCSAIEIFTGIVTIKSFTLAEQLGMSPDFTPLITLIGAVVSEVIGFAIYAIKSLKENTKGGIVYDTAMQNNICEENEEADA